MKRIFVGPKQLTISNNDFFDGSITLFGDNTNNNISFSNKVSFEYWNPDNNRFEIEIYNKEFDKLTEEVEIMAHSPQIVSKCTLPANVHLVCKNKQQLLELLDDKIETRKLMRDVVPMLEYHTVRGKDINYKSLKYIASDLVIQHPIGSGGSKTFLYNNENYIQIDKIIDKKSYYSVSAYQRNNIPYNIHCVIFDQVIEVLAPSNQVLEVTDLLEYIGSEFEIRIDEDTKSKLREYAYKVCKKIQNLGYRGVVGIDFIAVNKELYFIEINPRFQGSTAKLDKLLKESNLPSIFEYNYYAFKHREMPSTKNMKYSIMH